MEGQRFETFCREAHPPLVAALTHIVGQRAVAEELAQEALIRAYLRWGRVSQLASPLGWTVHVGANLGRSHLRRRAAERRANARSVDRPAEVESGTATEHLDAALAQLTAAQREVLVLRYLLDLSTEEVGRILGCGPDAVRQRSHRALERIRALTVRPVALDVEKP